MITNKTKAEEEREVDSIYRKNPTRKRGTSKRFVKLVIDNESDLIEKDTFVVVNSAGKFVGYIKKSREVRRLIAGHTPMYNCVVVTYSSGQKSVEYDITKMESSTAAGLSIYNKILSFEDTELNDAITSIQEIKAACIQDK